MACRLIPLDKNPGLRPIGVGEVLRRIAEKVVQKVVKEDIKKAAVYLQLRTGHEAGREAAIHAMHKIFESNETEAILIVDAENACNSINPKALLHNIEYLCLTIATFLYNCYAISARVFIIGGKEIRSREGTTQETQQQWQRMPYFYRHYSIISNPSKEVLNIPSKEVLNILPLQMT